MDKAELLAKHRLVKSSDWTDIRAYLFNEIETLAGSDIEPLKLQGLLLAIKIIDSWEDKYQKALLKEE